MVRNCVNSCHGAAARAILKARRPVLLACRVMRVVPDHFNRVAAGKPGPLTPMQVVAEALRYFALHFQDPIAIADLAAILEVSDDCLDFSFDQVRGMTPAQALLDFRLNQLFTTLSHEPGQRLGHAVRACGLGPTPGVLMLFEQTFGIAMPLFLLTCRRAFDDRVFRREHPEPEALVLPT